MTTADPLLLATARVSTFLGGLLQTNASGFFFERDARLYLVTSRHVVLDAASKLKADLDAGQTLADLIGKVYVGETTIDDTTAATFTAPPPQSEWCASSL